MHTWRILLADGLAEKGQEILRQACEIDDCQGVTAAELAAMIDPYEAIIVGERSELSAQILEAGKNLRVIGRLGMQVDNIDLAAAARLGIVVVNTPLAATTAVADYTLGAILSLARMIPRADASIKMGLWLKKEFQGVEVQGKTLGVIGIGQVGSKVSQLASVLGMQIIGYDPWLKEDAFQFRVQRVCLEELYQRADFISIHIPYSPETKELLGSQALAQMKRGVRLVCTMPGKIVDETALLGALESGQVAGVAIDVYASEPPRLTSLVAHPNVIATPHISAQTEEASIQAADEIACEVLAALRGEPLRWRIV